MISSAVSAFVTFSLFGLGGDTVNFDKVKPGAFPPFWTSASTRAEDSPRWNVLRDDTAPSRPNVFVKKLGAVSESEFSMAVFDKTICRDGDLSVKFQIKSGTRRVKTAGIVWRFQDPRNYYLLHFSVDESNIVLFRVQNGQAHPVPLLGGKPGAFGVSHELRTGEWYVAKVVFRGKSIKVLFGNRQLFEAVDETLPNAGKTGLWTRGSTEAAFDDFRIERKG